MKLLSIKAHGFKSFADKIEINIEDGITGIVGPNGSGKSNIVDAVKWVLGEQSVKTLRGGSSMTDVIFQGSNSRKPMTRAWVSLLFDNSDHYLNTEFDSVEIKRVVYNSGENEYYINNTKVRLKDITELFIDSGSSTNSFSIISQGKISEILNGKVETRRQIIEEAAGVLKYKKHKEETLRKIEKAEINISKVDLVINELESTLEPLKKDRDAAIKYKELKTEYDELDIILTTIDLENSESSIKEIKNNIDNLNKEISLIDTSTISDSSKIEKLKLSNTNLDIKINELQEQLININREISNVDAERKIALERKKLEVDDIKLQDYIINLKEKELSIKNNIELVTHELETLSQEKEKIDIKLNELNTIIEKNNNEKNILINTLNNKNINILKIKNTINILENNINNDYSLPSSVKNILSSRSLKGIHNIVGKLIDTSDEYKQALNVALGYNTNIVVVDNMDSAKKSIEYLKKEHLGRATFYPIDVIKEKYVSKDIFEKLKDIKGFINTLDKLVNYDNKYDNIIKNLLGNILVVDNIDTMNSIGKKINYTYKVVTLDGEILNTGGSVTGGSINNKNSIILDKLELNNKKHELEELELDINNIEEKITNLDKVLEDKTKLRTNIQDEYNNINNKIEIKLKNKETLLNEENDINNELSGNKDILDNSVDETLNKLLDKYYSLNKDKEIIEKDLNKLKSDKNDCLFEINELEINSKKINSNYSRLLNELKTNEVELSKHEIKMDNNLIKLNEEHHITFEEAIKNYDLNIDIKSSTNRLITLKRELALIPNVNLGSIEEFDRINERFEFLTTQKLDLVNSINNLMEVINELDKTMKENFITTFNKVNIEFNKVFKKLFKGGNGELLLTDPDDILNTGVDIIACPPGKTLKSINLLSGGEKTLTAIALLFSILNIRYVPFCLLDEVEAALDEANVDMFGNYISDIKDKTEFIIITHKKRTMEYANTLYGITMQESGVSKLVSVKLDDIK